ncbi:Mechanosensitive ion channel [Candidatus Propionivibrio aalborgensis]|uniref:Mechanosensitive ion channel n=1 Tax=Candidatus Propionivibrio aalborgensis TaxID=1860101 RepID=A0A1A8XXX4_9RHOO|nr:mechanosensitive ion channel family protein [Candidatus Propionivibrio aalborgensis]MBK7564040.1 mechanosensitive ion channel family protein [Propionivibrio sp.]SBT09556.1 Mechanosensitive ion channel [Candidatus Propionivibrio aalborgensis]
MDRSALEQVFSFGSQFSPAMALGFRITLIAALAWFAVILSHRMIRAFRLFISKNLADAEEVKRAATLGRVFRYIASVIISLITVTLILSELGISIAPILGAAGVVGVAVGFGAQSLVKDYFTGFFLLLENQIRQGDVIQAGGKAGVVEEITLRFVRMRDYDGNVHFVPNGTITTVTNMTRGHAHAVVDVGVAYRENVDQALEIMRQTGAELRADPAFAAKILEDVEIVGVEAWADSAVVLRCRFKVAPIEQWGVRREYLRRLKHAFDVAGIEIPFPHLTLYPGQNKDGASPPLHLSIDVAQVPERVK